MKDELNKKIRELCENAGSLAAVRMIPVLTADLDKEYDRRIEAGMVELDAYRDVLRSVDRIEAMLRSLPKDSAEEQGQEQQKPSEDRSETAAGERVTGRASAEPSRTRTAAADEVLSARKAREEGLKSLEFYTGRASALLWVGTTLFYFLWSLTFGGWHWTWLIFLWATLGQIVLSAAVDYNKTLNLRETLRSTLSGLLWVGATILFFIGGFGLHLWRFSWLVFLAATLVQILMGTFLPEGKDSPNR